MLPNPVLILGVAVLLLLVRVSGFYLASFPISPRWSNFLRYTPYGALTALVVAGVGRPQANLIAEVAALALAALAVRLTGQVWPGIAVGLTAFWLLVQFL